MASNAKRGAADEYLETGVALIGKGISATFRSPIKIAVLICTFFVAHYLVVNRELLYPEMPQLMFLAWLIPLAVLAAFGSMTPPGFDEAFEVIGFKNRKGEFPKLIGKEKKKTPKGDVQQLVFSSPGIPIDQWKANAKQLESALNGTILDIRKNKGSTRRVELELAGEGLTIPTMIEWNDKFIREKDFELVAGEGLIDDAVFDLNKYPHALIAGMTGSGKSVTLRCLLWQCIRKGAKLYIIDFKGGVEFKTWETKGFADVVTDEETATMVFNHLIGEMKMRLDLFTREGVKNISEFNKKHPEAPLCRIILGCDEVAEMLDVEGLSKEDKAEKTAISQAMASLARLSRAAGIHMLLGMQRPDAKVLKGQIKNNTPIRISGQFPDVVASQIVLNGLPDAAYLDNIQGRMLYNLGARTHEFQAYYFDDDKHLIPGNYQIGTTLNASPLSIREDPIPDTAYKKFEIPKSEMNEWTEADWLDVDF